MFLFLLEGKNLLLGGIPETVGLLIFGVGLIAVTILLRWFLNKSEGDEISEKGLEKITGKTNR